MGMQMNLQTGIAAFNPSLGYTNGLAYGWHGTDAHAPSFLLASIEDVILRDPDLELAVKLCPTCIPINTVFVKPVKGWYVPGRGGGNSKVTWDVASTIIGVLGTSSDIAKESGYKATIGSNLKYYKSGWHGNQYVNTLGVAKGLGYVSFTAGIAIDGIMYFTGQESVAKASVNIGVSAASLIIGGTAGIILQGVYMAVDKTVGWERMMTPVSNDQWVPNRAVFSDGTTIYVCFKAGTRIFTKVGFKPIEQIVVGDSVYSYNMEKNIIELNKVVKSFERKTQEIYEITTSNQKIYVTAEHPFYVVDSGWVKAKDLQAGAVLKTKDGSIERVITSVLKRYPETVFNIEVEGNHNYFVTNNSILVHNK